MTERDETPQQDVQRDAGGETPRAAADDRRGAVKPTDNPVPSSPEADEDVVREGEETLARVKPY